MSEFSGALVVNLDHYDCHCYISPQVTPELVLKLSPHSAMGIILFPLVSIMEIYSIVLIEGRFIRVEDP